MFNLSGVDWNDVANGVLGVVLFLLAWIGRRHVDGKPLPTLTPATPPAGGAGVAPAVEINALVDSKSLTNHASAIEALNLTQIAGQKQNHEIAHEMIGAITGLSKDIRAIGYALDKQTKEIDKMRDDVRDLTLELARHQK